MKLIIVLALLLYTWGSVYMFLSWLNFYEATHEKQGLAFKIIVYAVFFGLWIFLYLGCWIINMKERWRFRKK